MMHDEAEDLAKEVGGRREPSNADAVQGVEIVILAVPYDAVGSIIQEVGDGLAGKILVDVTNRFGGEEPGSVVDGTSNGEAIASMASDGRVVKAFNTVFASVRQTLESRTCRSTTSSPVTSQQPSRRSWSSLDPPGCARSTRTAQLVADP